MGFNTIYALWLLPSLGLIILMYLLKEEHEEMEISSLYLWKTVMAESEVKKPWQKLKNNILMLLQLLAAFLIIMALANPFIKSGKTLAGKIVIAIDNSGSMNAYYGEKTRLENAKSMAESIIREAPANSYFTILSLAKDAKVEISNTKDKNQAINKLKAIKATNIKGNINNQKSIIKAIYKQYDEATLLAYTDEFFSLDDDIKGEVINLGNYGENIAITNISYSDDEDGYTVMVRVENMGTSSTSREIALYADEILVGLKEIEISAGDSTNLYFYNIQKENKYLSAEITEEDILMEDNKAFLVLENPKAKKILMLSKGHIFLEKALTSIEGIELYKTDNFHIKDEAYDLYIFDGKSPKELPKTSNLFFINPDENSSIFEFLGSRDSLSASFEEHPINKYIEDYYFYINKANIIKKPYWAESLIVSNDNILGAAGKFEGRKVAYVSFDIRQSELPLNSEFPIFIYNLISYLVDLESKGRNFYQSGDIIDLSFSPDMESARIITPAEEEVSISKDILDYGYKDTDETGIYRLDYTKDKDLNQRIFAVNFPTEESRNAFSPWSESGGGAIGFKNFNSGFDLRKILIVIAILLVLLEWVVYIRGN